MTQRGPGSVDVRPFRWDLQLLERRRAHAVDEAAVRLAQTEQERDLIQAQIERAEAERSARIAALECSREAGLDPDLRLQALRCLVREQQALTAAHQSRSNAQGRCDAAREKLRRAHRELDVLARLRESALQAYLVQERRRRARQADLDWLAQHGVLEAPR